MIREFFIVYLIETHANDIFHIALFFSNRKTCVTQKMSAQKADFSDDNLSYVQSLRSMSMTKKYYINKRIVSKKLPINFTSLYFVVRWTLECAIKISRCEKD